MKNFLLLVLVSALVFGCASQRTRATCAETEYRLNSMSYSPDQRAFLEEELRQCRELQAEQEKDDVLTNKIKGSIYERFSADSAAADSAKGDSSVVEGNNAGVEAVSDSAKAVSAEDSPSDDSVKTGPVARRKNQRRNANSVMDEIAQKEAGGAVEPAGAEGETQENAGEAAAEAVGETAAEAGSGTATDAAGEQVEKP